MAFADEVEYPADSCYSEGLSLATTTNRKKLYDFSVRIQTSLSSEANFSRAFAEAFRLLSPANDSSAANNRRGIKIWRLKVDLLAYLFSASHTSFTLPYCHSRCSSFSLWYFGEWDLLTAWTRLWAVSREKHNDLLTAFFVVVVVSAIWRLSIDSSLISSV